MNSFDVVVLGAGGAGMMCAIQAGRRGRRVALLDHAPKVGGKILISGGGRCNFTNTGASAAQYVSKNPHFCKSALSRFGPEDFIQLVRGHGIAFHEKKLGQLFCDVSAKQIVDMLMKESEAAGARFFLNHKIESVAKAGAGWLARTDRGDFAAESLVVATGGLSLPKLGATGLGLELARRFGLNVVETAPALDGFTLADDDRRALDGLAGLSLDVEMACNGVAFRESLLFTHAGFSGPAALQASLHWSAGDEVRVNFAPALTPDELMLWFTERREGKTALRNLLSGLVPKRLAERFCDLYLPKDAVLAALSKPQLEAFRARLQDWRFVPRGTVGYGKAEVTRGGVDTDELSSKTMEARKAPGLFFIGEVVDVTGWLGGYNFQWAWASGWAAGQAV